MDIHLYLLCYRFEALVASHLPAEEFGAYMAVGSEKLSQGDVLFFEINPGLRSDYFSLADIPQRCVPHPDGSPKRSKYVSVYRVLEHLPLATIGKLYLVSHDGHVLGLDTSPWEEERRTTGANLYQELCPLPPLVVSGLSPAAFIGFMTDPANPVHVPRLFFADLLADRDRAGQLADHLPYPEPMHIADCMRQVEQHEGKPTKTVSRTPAIYAFFRTIRRGFFVGDQTGLRFYRFPTREKLESTHYEWWRSASAY